MSIGISIYPDDSGSVDELVKYADQAMYHVKESGKGHFKFSTLHKAGKASTCLDDIGWLGWSHFAIRTPRERSMKRRHFLKGVGAGSVVAGSMLAAPAVHAKAKYQWKMVTTWPKNFPGLGTGANHLAELITEMSGGRIEVKVYGAKELVPAFEIFDAVSRGTAEMARRFLLLEGQE